MQLQDQKWFIFNYLLNCSTIDIFDVLGSHTFFVSLEYKTIQIQFLDT